MNASDARKLRDAHVMPTHRGMKALVGWDGEVGTYWFAIVKVSIGADMQPNPVEFDDVFYAGGDELDRITNVAELIRRTWGEIYWWDAEQKIPHLLRNDPIVDAIREAVGNDEPYPADVEDFIIESLTAYETTPEKQAAATVRVAPTQPPPPAHRSPGGRPRFGRRDH